MKVVAAIPVPYDPTVIDLEVLYRITHQEGLPDDVEVDWVYVKGHDIGIERNELVRKCLEQGADKIWFIDSDVLVPKDALARLLNPEADVVMGFVPIRNTKTGSSAIYLPGTSFLKDNRIKMAHLDKLSTRTEVKGGGFGCVLRSASVFSRIDTPWFVYYESENGVRRGEDLGFCYKLEAEGIQVYADKRVRCGHRRSGYQYE